MRCEKSKIIGIACAVACAVCVFAFTEGVKGEADRERAEAMEKYGGEQVEVCVAVRDIAAGEVIDASSVQSQLWLATLLPDGALTATHQAIGQQATSPILAGEVISSKRFAALDLRFEVPEGLVALSVSAKEVQAVGGSLTPGCLVDVYAAGSSSAKRIAQNVLVLATSALSSDGSSSGSALTWVVLAVEPQAVEELIAAEKKTELYFALPGSGVDQLVEHVGKDEGASSQSASTAGKDAASSSQGAQDRADGAKEER